MSLYFGTTEITKLRDLAPQTGLDITDLWFGSTNVYTVWQTYEGTLPATLNANGDDMRQYRIYGNAGGVGDRTENLFDYTQLVRGYTYNSNGQMILNPDEGSRWRYAAIPFIQVTPGATYLRTRNLTPIGNTVNYYDSEKNFIAQATPGTGVPFTVPNNCYFITYVVSTDGGTEKYMLAEGSTAPASYEPFGYKLDMVSRTRNLLEITQDMYNPENWDLADPYQGVVYFMYYRLPQNVIERLQNIGTIAGTVYLKPNGSYGGEVLAITNLKGGEGTRPITNDYRLLTTNGVALNFSKNVSAWSDIYLGLGFSGGIPQDKRILIDDLFQNYNIMLNAGSIALPYEPYDYKTTPIYIGDDPLEEDEYVDYQAQKVYRMIDDTLTPTDPPVPLPALPTVNGTTIVDYAGQSVAPEKVLLKYRKEGF